MDTIVSADFPAFFYGTFCALLDEWLNTESSCCFHCARLHNEGKHTFGEIWDFKIFWMTTMNCCVKNANYDRVLAVVGKFLNARYRKVCSCPTCLNDIVAIALNYLPPHYYVDMAAERELGSPWVMVETAVAEAIDRVMENPKHPPGAAPVSD